MSSNKIELHLAADLFGVGEMVSAEENERLYNTLRKKAYRILDAELRRQNIRLENRVYECHIGDINSPECCIILHGLASLEMHGAISRALDKLRSLILGSQALASLRMTTLYPEKSLQWFPNLCSIVDAIEPALTSDSPMSR